MKKKEQTDFNELASELASLGLNDKCQGKGFLVARVLHGMSQSSWRKFCKEHPASHWGGIPVSSMPVARLGDSFEDSIQSAQSGLINAFFAELITRQLDRELKRISRSGGELSIIIASPLLTTADNSSQLLSDLTAALAKVMLSSLEDCDSLARNADGDPIAILPGTGYVKSRHIAEQLQKDFSKSAMPIHAGASCAIGIVSISKEEKSAAELLTRAETALIEAKTLQSHIRQIGPEYIEDRSTLVHSDEKRFLFFGR